MRKICALMFFCFAVALSSCEKDDKVLTLNPESETIGIGCTATIKAMYDADAVDGKTLKWSSDNPSVATVVRGVITGVAEGTATITVTTADGALSATCAVTVQQFSLVGSWLAESASGRMVITFNKEKRYVIIIPGVTDEVGVYSERASLLYITPQLLNGDAASSDVRMRPVTYAVGPKTLTLSSADIFYDGNPHDFKFPLTLNSAI